MIRSQPHPHANSSARRGAGLADMRCPLPRSPIHMPREPTPLAARLAEVIHSADLDRVIKPPQRLERQRVAGRTQLRRPQQDANGDHIAISTTVISSPQQSCPLSERRNPSALRRRATSTVEAFMEIGRHLSLSSQRRSVLYQAVRAERTDDGHHRAFAHKFNAVFNDAATWQTASITLTLLSQKPIGTGRSATLVKPSSSSTTFLSP